MSVTFTISGERADYEDPSTFINVGNANAADLLRWLGYECDGLDMVGAFAPGDLRARCLRRLDVSRFENVTDDLPRGSFTDGRFTSVGRDLGYLKGRTLELLALAERAGDRAIEFS